MACDMMHINSNMIDTPKVGDGWIECREVAGDGREKWAKDSGDLVKITHIINLFGCAMYF